MLKMTSRKEHENDLCEFRPPVFEIAATTVQNKQAHRPRARTDSSRTMNAIGTLMPSLQSRLSPEEFEQLDVLHQKYKASFTATLNC